MRARVRHHHPWNKSAGTGRKPIAQNRSHPRQAAIDSSFGSLDELKAKFNAAAAGRFGSGWAWLGVKADGSLAITSTPNQVGLTGGVLRSFFAGVVALWSRARKQQ
jgi:superoxide dismutase